MARTRETARKSAIYQYEPIFLNLPAGDPEEEQSEEDPEEVESEAELAANHGGAQGEQGDGGEPPEDDEDPSEDEEEENTLYVEPEELKKCVLYINGDGGQLSSSLDTPSRPDSSGGNSVAPSMGHIGGCQSLSMNQITATPVQGR